MREKNQQAIWDMEVWESIPCGIEETPGLPDYIVDDNRFPLPESYRNAEYMVSVARTIREQEERRMITLPLCQTVEVELLGGNVKLGTDAFGGRVGQPAYNTLQELPLDDQVPARQEVCDIVVEALRKAKELGEETMLTVSGPFTVLSGLVPMEQVFYVRRKDPDLYRKALQWVSHQLIRYMKQAAPYVSIYSIADPAAGAKIIGKTCVQELAEQAYLPILREMQRIKKPVHICPRLAGSVLQQGRVKCSTKALPYAMNYEEALLTCKEEGVLLAGACIKAKKEKNARKELQVWELI